MVLLRFWQTSLAIELEYQLNMLIELVSVLGNLFGSLFILSLFYKSGPLLGGWNFFEALIVLGIYMILEGITTSILAPNLSRIVNHVKNGTLDYVLLKPIDSQLWLSLRIISPWGLPSQLIGILLIIYSLVSIQVDLSLFNILIFFTCLFASSLILYSLWFLLASTSIWFVKVWNATEVLRSILVAGRYPMSAYPRGLRTIFTFLIPIAFLTTVPAEVIIGRVSNEYIAIILIIAAIFFAISRRFWKFALLHYTSASS